MLAGDDSERGRMHVCGHPRTVEMYGDKPVPVVVSVDDEGTHWGWLDVDRAGEAPTMVQPHYGLYSMQFPYGPEAEEQRGRGRTVRLRVEEVGDV